MSDPMIPDSAPAADATPEASPLIRAFSPGGREDGRRPVAGEMKQMLREMAADAEELKRAVGGSITDTVAGWLAPQYLLAARAKLEQRTGADRLEVLRTFLHDWALLRRGDHSAARLQLDREELEWQRANSAAGKEKEFREWIKRPEVRREFLPDHKRCITQETIEKIERELRLF